MSHTRTFHAPSFITGGELSWQQERKLRAVSLLISLLDEGGSMPARPSVADDVMGFLLASSAAQFPRGSGTVSGGGSAALRA